MYEYSKYSRDKDTCSGRDKRGKFRGPLDDLEQEQGNDTILVRQCAAVVEKVFVLPCLEYYSKLACYLGTRLSTAADVGIGTTVYLYVYQYDIDGCSHKHAGSAE